MLKRYICHSVITKHYIIIFWKTSAPTVCPNWILLLKLYVCNEFVRFFYLTEEASVSLSRNNFLSSISTEGLNDVILYHQPDDKKKNRGFCFLEYEDHKTAAQARRRLMSGKVKVWGNVVTVEWADPIEDPDPEVMAKVRCFPRVALVQQQIRCGCREAQHELFYMHVFLEICIIPC